MKGLTKQLPALALLALAWWLLRLAIPASVASPTEVVGFVRSDYRLVLASMWQTTWQAGAGLAVAVIVASAAGVASVLYARMAPMLTAVAVVLKATPAIAFVPLIVTLVGPGAVADKIITSAIIAFFPIYLGWLDGVERMPERLRMLATSYGASQWAFFRHIAWSFCLDAVTFAMVTAAPLAVVGACVAGSLSGEPGGIGAQVAMSMNHPERQLTWIAAAGIVGVASYYAAYALHSRVRRALRLTAL